MKIYVSEQEWYPVFEFEKDDERGWELNVPDEKVKEWKKVYADFVRIQEEIRKEYEMQTDD